MNIAVRPPLIFRGRRRTFAAVGLPTRRRTRAPPLLLVLLVLALCSVFVPGERGVGASAGADAEGGAAPPADPPADPDRPGPWSAAAAAAANRFRDLVARNNNVFSRGGDGEGRNDDEATARLFVDDGRNAGVTQIRAYCTKSKQLLGFVVGYVDVNGGRVKGELMGKRRKNNAIVRMTRLETDEAVVTVRVDTSNRGQKKQVEDVHIGTSFGNTYKLCGQSEDGGVGEDRETSSDVTSKTLAEESHHVVGFTCQTSPKSSRIRTVDVHWAEDDPPLSGRDGEAAVNFVSSRFDAYMYLYMCSASRIQLIHHHASHV